MSISFRRSTALLGAGCALAAASIVAASPAGASAPTQRRGIVYLHTTHKHTIAGRSTVRPGVVQIHNSGNQPMLLLSSKHANIDKLASDFKKHQKKLLHDFAVRDALAPHRGVWLRLNRGALYAVDITRDHFAKSVIHVVTVSGKTVNAPLPFSHAVTVTGHNVLKVPKNVAHKTVFHVVNNSHHLQSIAIFRIGKKTSLKEIRAVVSHPTEANLEKLDFDFGHVVELGELSPHQTLWTRSQIGKGNGLVVAIALTSKNINLFRKGGLGAIHFH